MRLPPIDVRAGESIDVQWFDGGTLMSFVLTERGVLGVWISRATLPTKIVVDHPHTAAQVVREKLDEAMAESKRLHQMMTS